MYRSPTDKFDEDLAESFCRLSSRKGECGIWHFQVELVLADDRQVVGSGSAELVSRYRTWSWPEGLVDAADSQSEDLYLRAKALTDAYWDEEEDELIFETFDGVASQVLFIHGFTVDEKYRGRECSYRMMRFLLDMPLPTFTWAVLLPGPLVYDGETSSEARTETVGKLQKHWADFGFTPLKARVGDMRLYGYHLSFDFPEGSWAAEADWLEAS